MKLNTASRKTTITETVRQPVTLHIPGCKYIRRVTLVVNRMTSIGLQHGEVTYSATLSVACAIESAEIDSQVVTGCVPCQRLFNLFSGTSEYDTVEARLNAIRNAIEQAADWDGCDYDPYPLAHRERIRALLPAFATA